MRLKIKKKLSFTLIVMTLTLVFLSIIGINSYTNIVSEDNNSIDDISSLKISYFNLTMSPIVINGSATGVVAKNWTWAADQDWCTNKSGILYLENLTINAGGTGSCIEITDSHEQFVIRNCTLYNSGSSSRDSGIKLVETSRGFITENNISSNNVGITMMNNVSLNNITKNMITNNAEYGILIVNLEIKIVGMMSSLKVLRILLDQEIIGIITLNLVLVLLMPMTMVLVKSNILFLGRV